MYPDFEEVDHRIRRALDRMVEEDLYLLEVDANERSLSHKLAEYLQSEFDSWNVDCEYNRDGHDPKRVYLTPVAIQSDDDKGTTVYPDIIVHKRGTQLNLLCVEMKKASGSEKDCEKDKNKLECYKTQLGYRFSLFVILSTGHGKAGYDVDLREAAA